MSTVTIGSGTYESLADVWEGFVGEQTPAEFLAESGTDDPARAVDSYLEGVRTYNRGDFADVLDYCGDDDAATLADARRALVAYLGA
jgi:hypothetical protein